MPTYTNLSILQGWLAIELTKTVNNDCHPTLFIQGWIYSTDFEGLEDCFDERHPIIITGRPAEAVLDISRKLDHKYPHLNGINLVNLFNDSIDPPQVLVNQRRPFVIAQGKLLTYAGQSCVDVKHISFLGFPWGALDALDELRPIIHRDLHALVTALTPQEKCQMNQVIRKTVREIMDLRTYRQ